MSSDKPFQAEVKGFFDQRSLNVGLRNLLRLEWTVDAVMASDHLRLVNFNDLSAVIHWVQTMFWGETALGLCDWTQVR